MMWRILLLGVAVSLAGAEIRISVQLNEKLGKIDPRIFGHFTEETLSSYEGSILSEMLYNRKFEIPEERGKGNFNHIGTANGWEPIAMDPAVSFLVDRRVFYSPAASQRITKAQVESRAPAGIQQRGYRYVMPHLSPDQRLEDPFLLRAGKHYRVRAAIKNLDLHGTVTIALGESWQKPSARCELPLQGGEDWHVFNCTLTPDADVPDGKFLLWFNQPGTIWVDSVSLIRDDLDDGGFRRDAIEVTRRMNPTSLRWPGGWFVSDYDWRHGIGPVDKRPVDFNRAWNGWVSNDVGIDEYLELCRKLKAAPYVCVNVGTGTPKDAADLVRYTKGRVKDWNIGNEEYLLTLGGTNGAVYGRRFQEFAKAMRALDPNINLVAVGAFDMRPGAIPPDNPMYKFTRFLVDWNRLVAPQTAPDMNLYSVHYYEPQGALQDAPLNDVLYAGLASAENLSQKVDGLLRQMREYVPGGPHYPLAMDEWAVWMPKKLPPEAGAKPPAGLKDSSQFGLYGSANMLRDALSEAPIYNLMQRRPRDFGLASRTMLWGYALGIVAVGREKTVAGPSARMMELYGTHERCEAVRVITEGSPTFDVPAKGTWLGAKGAPYLDVSARVLPDGRTLDVFIVNRNLSEDLDAAVKVNGGNIGSIESATLNGADAREWNSFQEPERVTIRTTHVSTPHGHFPAHSITKWTIKLQ